MKRVIRVGDSTDPGGHVLTGYDPYLIYGKAYPWSAKEKRMGYEEVGNEYETAINNFPEKWELPFLLGGPALRNPGYANYLKTGLCGARTVWGMHYAPPNRQNHLRPFWEAQGGAPVAFKPSRFVKRPWCQEQLVQFDLLKILARLHRPQTAQYVRDSKFLGSKDREKAFLEAWEKALATLPEGEKPVRVIYDFGPKGATHLAPMTLAIRTAGPDLDVMGKDGIDVTARMRDTGANGPYVALALGILATQKQGGVSAVVNLRREDRATVMMVSPPTEADKVQRKIHFKSDYMGTIDQE